MKESLKNKEWREFILADIFDISSTKSGIDKNKLILKKGKIPYITRTDKNNGYDYFVCSQNEKYIKDKKNVITIGLDTQTVFYQSQSFYTGQNIQILSSEKLNAYNAMFIIPLLKRLMEKFNWGGNGATLTRLKRSKILLPINKNKTLDYEYMETYMLEKETVLLGKYKKYILKHMKNIKKKKIKSVSEIQWREFTIEELFSSKIGKSIDGNKVDKKRGDTAYITRKESNNGLDGFINYNEQYKNTDCPVLTIGNETAEPFLQLYDFFTGTKVNILKPRNNISKYTMLFIAQCLKKHECKYSYSYTINSTRLKKQKILLPANKKNNPDYEYMEQYMQNLEYKKLEKYLAYYKKSSVA